jgi:PRTRC genetic system protein C
MANFIKYGDRTLPMEGLTLEQAKQLMARHFPELAEPQVDRKEQKDGDVVYTFTKKAGRKGA